MNTYTTTIIVQSPEHLRSAEWNRCISDAVEKYRKRTGQDVRRMQFFVKGEEA